MPRDALVDDGVRARIGTLRQEADRRRHATGAVLSDLLVRAHGGPGARVVRARDAAPVVEGAELYVSVAHGGDWVAVAVTAVAPIGVDVEPLARPADVDGLAPSVLAPAERDILALIDGDVARQRAFLTWWTRKEAVLKATGDGLRVDPREVVLSGPDAPPRVVGFAARPELRAGSALADLAPDAAHVGAVAVLAPEPVTLAVLDGAALLAGRVRPLSG
jgi:4'-phosphopantetheinyl transferase